MKTIVASHNPDLARDFDRDLLRRNDLRLVPARNTSELLSRLRQGADLCFLDRVMPDGDGVSVLELIRSERSLDPLPVVLVTAAGAPDGDPHEARRVGFADVIELPAPPGGLSLVVGRLLGVPLRRDERFPVRVHVFDAAATPTGISDAYVGTSIDLSEAGILVKAQRDPAVGTQLRIRFALPGRPTELTATGRVVRVDIHAFEPQKGLAVKFEDLSAEDKDALQAYLRVLTAGRPFYWQLTRPTEPGARPTVTLAGLIGGPTELAPLKTLTGPIDYRLRDLERPSATGVQHWMEFVRSVNGTQRLRLLECPVWFVQHAGRIPNLLEGQELHSFYAPFVCTGCGMERDRLLELERDLEGGKRRTPPPLACDACSAALELAEPAEAYFAFL
jgi:CheY-like chemotaxis protein